MGAQVKTKCTERQVSCRPQDSKQSLSRTRDTFELALLILQAKHLLLILQCAGCPSSVSTSWPLSVRLALEAKPLRFYRG